ncbi:hypothetical protein NESM_000578800 [Novymonas esmeraldas]|uniref:Uncharacterized protein n=1 Tax=Novymonas esmeraldas TaxID=1808958 RepID=A0AAW0ESB3_9TRYP
MADAAAEGDVRLMSREERIASYRELVEGLDDILASHDADADADGDDAEQMAALVEEVETQLRTLAQLLNAEECVQVTPGLRKLVEVSPETAEVCTTIVYPPPPASGSAAAGTLSPAPYELLFDERDWYPCVITAVLPPAKDVDRVQYKAWILGHNVEEVVCSEALRPWRPTESTGDIQNGVHCHVIHPVTGRYVAGVVDRLTLEETVLVKVPSTPPPSSSSSADINTTTTTTVAVPLSHVRVGKFFAQLRRRPKTEEERATRRVEQSRLKRERAAQQRQLAASSVAADAGEWQALMGDIMGADVGGGGKRSAKRRRT